MKRLIVLLLLLAMAGIASAEIMPDGGFESGLWAGTGGYFSGAYDNAFPSPTTWTQNWNATWWQNATVGSTSDARTGSNAVKVTMIEDWSWVYTWSYGVTYGAGGPGAGDFSFSWPNGGWAGVWETNLAASEGDVLLASAWMKDATGDGGAAGIGKLQLEFYDASGQRMWDDEVYQYFDTTSDWAQHSISATVPTGTADIHMFVGHGSWGVGRSTLFDDVSVTIVPEPISIALLSLGGLFLRRRKA